MERTIRPSEKNLDIVLAQIRDQREDPTFLNISRKLKPSNWIYFTTEKECAAIMFALKKLRCYFDGHLLFIKQTNHNRLVWRKTRAGTNQRLLRWVQALQQFNYKIEHST